MKPDIEALTGCIVGQFFDKGEIGHPVSELNIADNRLLMTTEFDTASLSW